MKLKVIVLMMISLMISGCYVGNLIEASTTEMKAAIEQSVELEKPNVVEAKVVETVEDSTKWEQNKVESTERYAMWDNWRDEYYEYQFNDQELKIRLSNEYRSDYYWGYESFPDEGDQIGQTSQFELMLQNKTDRPFTLSVNEQDFIFLIDGEERTYGSTKNLEYNRDFDYPDRPWYQHVNERPDGFQFQLEPFGTYDKTGMKRRDLVILFFRAFQPLSTASMDNIFKDDKEILEEEIIPIKVDDIKGGPGFVTIRLNDKSYKLGARNGWSGLPFLEDIALHNEIKLDHQVTTIANMPDYMPYWRGRGLTLGERPIYTLSRLRDDFLIGKDYATLGLQNNKD